MKIKEKTGILLAGTGAGLVNGLFGTGGGMVLVPLLTQLTQVQDQAVFPTSVSIILPVCFVSLFASKGWPELHYTTLLPYLIGSALGGILCGFLGRKIPTLWLHRLLGLLIIWGGIRYLC